FDILTFPRHLPAMAEALRATPGLHAILDHISKPDMSGPPDMNRPDVATWAEGIRSLAAVPGLHCKISGLVTEAGPNWTPDRIRPYVTLVAEAFGPERLVFGSDWPVCTLAATHGQVVDLARELLSSLYGADAMQGIMQDNG